jgi:hypothetical protein
MFLNGVTASKPLIVSATPKLPSADQGPRSEVAHILFRYICFSLTQVYFYCHSFPPCPWLTHVQCSQPQDVKLGQLLYR